MNMWGKGRGFGWFVAVLLVAALPVLASAVDVGDVKVELTAHKVTLDKDGKEVLLVADKAKPGEVLEYRATYRNRGEKGVEDVKATLPIPRGTEYLPGTADPSGVLASLDGGTYKPVPLKRTIKVPGPDGKMVDKIVDVPYEEYRSLRWDIGKLEAEKSRVVSARVRLTPVVFGDTPPPAATAAEVK